jgi:hypothetical protein
MRSRAGHASVVEHVGCQTPCMYNTSALRSEICAWFPFQEALRRLVGRGNITAADDCASTFSALRGRCARPSGAVAARDIYALKNSVRRMMWAPEIPRMFNQAEPQREGVKLRTNHG